MTPADDLYRARADLLAVAEPPAPALATVVATRGPVAAAARVRAGTMPARAARPRARRRSRLGRHHRQLEAAARARADTLPARIADHPWPDTLGTGVVATLAGLALRSESSMSPADDQHRARADLLAVAEPPAPALATVVDTHGPAAPAARVRAGAVPAWIARPPVPALATLIDTVGPLEAAAWVRAGALSARFAEPPAPALVALVAAGGLLAAVVRVRAGAVLARFADQPSARRARGRVAADLAGLAVRDRRAA